MRHYLKSIVGIVIIINLLLAIVVLLRDIFLAAYLGTSWQADAFFLAYFLPDTIGNNLIAAAIGISCIPVFSKLYASRHLDRLLRGIGNVTGVFLALSLILMILCYIYQEMIIGYLGAGFSHETKSLCIQLYRIILPSLLFFPLITIGSAVLQTYDRFNLPALAPVCFNIVFLGGVLYGHLYSVPLAKGAYIIVWSIITGILLMAVIVWVPIINGQREIVKTNISREGVILSPEESKDMKEVWHLFVPYFFILIFSQAVLFAERYFASQLEVGSIAGLNYAYRLAQFPLWTFVLAVITVNFPEMSRTVEVGLKKELRSITERVFQSTLIFTVPLSFALLVLRKPVISVLLHRGTFNERSLEITAGILAGYALIIVWQGIVIVALRVFLASRNIILPMLATLASAVITVLTDYFLVRLMGSPGLGYGAALGAFINALFFVFLLKKELDLELEKCFVKLGQVILASLPLGTVLVFFKILWDLFHFDQKMLWTIGYVLSVVLVGLVVYGVSLYYLQLWNPFSAGGGGKASE